MSPPPKLGVPGAHDFRGYKTVLDDSLSKFREKFGASHFGVPGMHCHLVQSLLASPSTTRSVTRTRDSGRGGPSHVPSPAVECTLASSASTLPVSPTPGDHPPSVHACE